MHWNRSIRPRLAWWTRIGLALLPDPTPNRTRGKIHIVVTPCTFNVSDEAPVYQTQTECLLLICIDIAEQRGQTQGLTWGWVTFAHHWFEVTSGHDLSALLIFYPSFLPTHARSVRNIESNLCSDHTICDTPSYAYLVGRPQCWCFSAQIKWSWSHDFTDCMRIVFLHCVIVCTKTHRPQISSTGFAAYWIFNPSCKVVLCI